MAAASLRPVLWLSTRPDWRGAENIPPSGGCLIVANHTSMFDPPVVAHFVYDNGRSPRFLAKSSLFKVPLMGRVLRGAGQIPVYRESRDATKAFTAAVEAVNRGECVLVYPEGTVTRDPQLWPMAGKTGAARIALATGAPVIPVAQWGAQLVLPRHAKFPRLLPPKKVVVRAGPPVDLDDLRGSDHTADVLREVTERLLDAVTGLLGEIRGEQPPPRRLDSRTPIAPTAEALWEPEAGEERAGDQDARGTG